MNFIISSTVLLKNLQSISGALASSNAHPLLDHFLFTIEDTDLVVTATDLETTMSVKLTPDKIEEGGSFAIPAKILLDTLKTFANVPLNIAINKEMQLVTINAGQGIFKLSCSLATGFPEIPHLEEPVSVVVNSEVLSTAITKTMFATGNDELRPVMSGIFCQLDEEGITFVATDAHKLVRYRNTEHKVEEAKSIIFPKKALGHIKNILQTLDVDVNIEFDYKHASFVFSDITVITRLVEGKYPNYESVIPVENSKILIVDRVQLLNSLKRVGIFANQSTNQVRFKIVGQELLLSAEDLDLFNEAEERLTCNYEGEDIEIGFNSKFFIEMLYNLDSEQIKLEMTATNRAGLIFPINTEQSAEDILMLVMPVMLNQ